MLCALTSILNDRFFVKFLMSGLFNLINGTRLRRLYIYSEQIFFEPIMYSLRTYSYIIVNYNPLVKIMSYLLRLPMLCVLILSISGRVCSLKSKPTDKFLKNFSWQFSLLSEFFYISFCVWRRNWGFKLQANHLLTNRLGQLLM